MLRIGDILYGYCNGYFGCDSYNDKRVEAIGSDWVVARGLWPSECLPEFYQGNPEELEEFKTEKEE